MKDAIKISDDYIAGFVDGEGCFALSVRRDVRHERTSKATYYAWKASFAICLRSDDHFILDEIKRRFECGSVTYTVKKATVRFQVSNVTELYERVVPFFKKAPLYGKKAKDFILWAEAVGILNKYKVRRGRVNITKGLSGFQKIEWTQSDLDRLKHIQKLSSQYKSNGFERKWLKADLGRGK